MQRILLIIFFLHVAVLFSRVSSEATNYYIDSRGGSDLNSGLSAASPWHTISKVNQFPFLPGDNILFKRGETWRDQLIPHNGSQDGYVTYGAYGIGDKPLLLGSVNKSLEQDWTLQRNNIWYSSEIQYDVGNVIFNNEGSVGVKVRNETELDQQGEFWYDPDSSILKLYSKTNPAFYYTNIECALKRDIINQGGKEYIIYENLDVRYGGAHGIGGGNVHHIIVRDCDFSYMGGSRQYDEVRYGNGIEFWNSAHDTMVEGCRLWDIYDAALTTQGSGEGNNKYNQYFLNNIVWNSEYCFEYWNRPETSTTNNIFFENNTCVNAGHGWGHNQRWKETDAGWHNGRHLAFYKNTAITTNFYVRNNIFYEAKNVDLYFDDPWDGIDNTVLDYNAWYQLSGIMIYYFCTWDSCYGEYTMNEFQQYQTDTGKGAHSLAEDPLFVDVAKNDFHPVTGSPVCTISETGSYVGALPCVDVNIPLASPELLYPPDGWISPETTIEFRWKKSSDADDKVVYALYICEDNEFISNCIIKEDITYSDSGLMFIAISGILVFTLSVVFMGVTGNKKRSIILIALIVLTSLTLITCGSSEVSTDDGMSSLNHSGISLTVSEFKTGTEYFWRVIAHDGEGGESASETRSFSVL